MNIQKKEITSIDDIKREIKSIGDTKKEKSSLQMI